MEPADPQTPNFMTPEDLNYLPPKQFAPKPIRMDYPIPISPPKQ